MPRISVVLPVYNAKQYLSSALGSVLGQTFKDFELLLFDDGSVDGSLEIAQAIAAQDSRVDVISEGHRGLVGCLNAGIERARGEFIARMDADDICMPNRFEIQLTYLQQHPDCCAVGSQAIRIDPESSPINPWHVPETHEEIENRHLQGTGGGLIHPSVMLRTKSVRQIAGYRETYEAAEDYDLFLRLAEIGRLVNLPTPLLYYRLHTKSVSLSRAGLQHDSSRKALIETWRRRQISRPLPPPEPCPNTLSLDELKWSWTLNAFAARNYSTSKKHATSLLRSSPFSPRRWFLFIAVFFGPISSVLKNIMPFRMGTYDQVRDGANIFTPQTRD
jgi:glycosyltransferase involved in cell wall biosynthesis